MLLEFPLATKIKPASASGEVWSVHAATDRSTEPESSTVENRRKTVGLSLGQTPMMVQLPRILGEKRESGRRLMCQQLLAKKQMVFFD